ncbi:unnamed protein product [Durusdinium trenchii]|uniref:Uncharacterized protein n=1 Tax=Durusdinium trenchii TaxID=1381693 RepID=A0ABP0I731_9DINO
MGRSIPLLPWILLIVRLSAIRDVLSPDRLSSEPRGKNKLTSCEKEKEQTERLLKSLGVAGEFAGDHCTWPGIRCDDQSCKVVEFECDTCVGRLPDNIDLEHLRKVYFDPIYSNVTGNIAAFQSMKDLRSLVLSHLLIGGNIRALQSISELEELDLGHTQVEGDIQVFAAMHNLYQLELQNTRVEGSLEILKAMPRLETLNLAATRVTGDISALIALEDIREVDLSGTYVYGFMTESWAGKCQILEMLNLTDTRIGWAHGSYLYSRVGAYVQNDRKADDKLILPALKSIDLSKCARLYVDISDLLLILGRCAKLSQIKAKNTPVTGKLDFTLISSWSPASFALQTLDLGATNITSLIYVPNMKRILVDASWIQSLQVSTPLLTNAAASKTILDLTGTHLGNPTVAAGLLATGKLNSTDGFAERNDQQGFVCKELVRGGLHVTPSTFLPEVLCKCQPGWHGTGANCTKCPANTWKAGFGPEACEPCPQNSTSKAGSSEMTQCKCDFGDLQGGKCSCNAQHGLQDDSCVPCAKRNLQCYEPGSVLATAVPEQGYIRLHFRAENAHRCLSPAEVRCSGGDNCTQGYSGILCSSCADGFWATGNRCRNCTQTNSTSLTLVTLLAAAALLVAVYLGYRWMYRTTSVGTLLQNLMLLQSPILLQLVQLWSVLSHLGTRQSGNNLPEIPYLEGLQLTATELQNSMNLQCAFGGKTVRALAAFSSPLVPLGLLLCCSTLEIFRPGLGVNMALKTLTLFFIGGASSTAQLLSCQDVDGDERPIGIYAFRSAFPQLRCADHSGLAWWVDVVGYSCALAYGVLIPLFLAGLMVRQHFALQDARLFSAFAMVEPPKTTIQVRALEGVLSQEVRSERLLVAAAAHLAVYCRGQVEVSLQKEEIILTSLRAQQGEVAEELDPMKLVADAKSSKNLDKLKSRKIVEMLTERLILRETSDRLLKGAQPQLCKYTLGQDLWMDVAMKLFAVALVSCVSMSSAWKWAVAICLGMAVLVWVTHPYMQPQVGTLQSLSCFCLALASVAFVYPCPWLARVALIAPVLLVLLQVRSPDCTEALAERCYQDLEKALPKLKAGKAHEIHVQLLHL